MDIQSLKCFIETSKCGSIAQASESSFISRQGVSASIAKLEKELSCKLFDRSSHGVDLTEEGKIVLPYAIRAVEIINECTRAIAQSLSKEQRLDVYVCPGVIPEIAFNMIINFKSKYPNSRLTLTEANPFQCEAAIKEQIAEIALTTAPLNTEEYDAQQIYTIPYVLVVKKDHPFAKKESI
jgi:LysR family cyn operon transcriptional activator